MDKENRCEKTYSKAVGISEPTLLRLKSYCKPRHIAQAGVVDDAVNHYLDHLEDEEAGRGGIEKKAVNQ